MRKLMFLLLAVLTLASCSEEKVNVRWATFNMRYDNPSDAPNHWSARKERVAQYIKDMKFDVFGTQEVLHNQFEDLKALLRNNLPMSIRQAIKIILFSYSLCFVIQTTEGRKNLGSIYVYVIEILRFALNDIYFLVANSLVNE